VDYGILIALDFRCYFRNLSRYLIISPNQPHAIIPSFEQMSTPDITIDPTIDSVFENRQAGLNSYSI